MNRFYFPQAVGVAVLTLWAWWATPASAQVLFQQFYYPIERPADGKTWWQQATVELAALKRLEISAIWHPVPTKGGSGAVSMGYDPYDLYDLGSKDQKGTVATNFGTKDQYLAYIAAAHACGIRVYADVVLNHAGGADIAEPNPFLEQRRMDDIPDDSKAGENHRPRNLPTGTNLRSWTGFAPRGADGTPGTGRFPRNFRHFHPSSLHPDRNPPYHNPEFGADYCFETENRYVWNQLCDWGIWFREQTGVDGFRLDAVKLADPPFLNAFAAHVTAKPLSDRTPFYLVGEYWDTNANTLADFQTATENRMRLFDFGLFYALWDMTEKPGEFDMRDLWIRRFADRERAVMFVSNHDVDRFQPIKRNRRILPYAITMTMAGQPSIFYLDYFKPEDANLVPALHSLTEVQNRFAKGEEILRFADADVLAFERKGSLLALFNDGGKENAPRTVTIPTALGANTELMPVGQWGGNPPLAPTKTSADGTVTATILPGNYLLLVPKKTRNTVGQRSAVPLPTTQTWEFADDLDTAPLGTTPRTVTVTAGASTTMTGKLTGLTGKHQVRITVENAAGRILSAVDTNRAVSAGFVLRVPETGLYHIRITSSSDRVPARLRLTYTGAEPQ